MFNCAKSPYTPQVHLSCLGPTISSSVSSLASAPPLRRVHRWGVRPNFPLWSSAVSYYTLSWGEVLRLPLPPPPGGIFTPHLPHVPPSYPWYTLRPSDGTPPKTLSYTTSPPRSHFRIRSPNVTTTYKSPPGPAPLLTYSPEPSQSPPTASATSSGSGTPPPNICKVSSVHNHLCVITFHPGVSQLILIVIKTFHQWHWWHIILLYHALVHWYRGQ